MNYKEIEKFLNEYPEMFNSLQLLTSIDIYDVLKEIEEKHNLTFDSDILKNYENQESVKLLRKFK